MHCENLNRSLPLFAAPTVLCTLQMPIFSAPVLGPVFHEMETEYGALLSRYGEVIGCNRTVDSEDREYGGPRAA